MRISLVLPLILMVISCGNGDRNRAEDNNIDFGGQNLYSGLFNISHEESYSVLTLSNPWQGSGDISLRYYISQYPDSLPAGIDPGSVIITPVDKVVCLSTTHLAMIDRLGESESVCAVSGAAYVSNINIRKRIDAGLVKEIGYDNSINNELIATIDPDVVFAYGIGPESAGYVSKLKEAGIPVLFISDYLETDPLARAEWLKVFALIYGREKEAKDIFEHIAGEYEVLRQMISTRVSERPAVMTGLPYKDTWFVSPGNSYISKIIWDAGGEYLWQDVQSDISMPMSLESVYIKSREADIWINAGNSFSLNDIISVDPRLGDLPPVLNKQVYNNIKGLTAAGGNEYWESGVLQPQVVLKDLVSIFHPGLIPGYDQCFYIRLEEK